jgi:hypothetical protein
MTTSTTTTTVARGRPPVITGDRRYAGLSGAERRRLDRLSAESVLRRLRDQEVVRLRRTARRYLDPLGVPVPELVIGRLPGLELGRRELGPDGRPRVVIGCHLFGDDVLDGRLVPGAAFVDRRVSDERHRRFVEDVVVHELAHVIARHRWAERHGEGAMPPGPEHGRDRFVRGAVALARAHPERLPKVSRASAPAWPVSGREWGHYGAAVRRSWIVALRRSARAAADREGA